MSTRPDDPTPTAGTGQVASQGRGPATLDGPLLRSLFIDASSLLERHIRVLNAINVFPVPDGDTGTNMHLTLRAGIEEMAAGGDDLPSVVGALAHGSLMGARGNSGVILSQILRGLAEAVDGSEEADAPAIATALVAGAEAAYDALSDPVEGTILTVAREAAEAVSTPAPDTIEEALSRASAGAQESVERTPELLPVLKEAGVVDAGGLGLAVVLEGLRRSLCGEPLDVMLAPGGAVEDGWRSEAASLHEAKHGETGYCTEFVVSGKDIEQTAVREHLAPLGGSLLVVGGDGMLRVHLHTVRPDEALAYGRTLGELSHVKVENMEAQIRRFVSREAPSAPVTASIAVVAIAAGEGIEATFRGVGVNDLVPGGQTMNPSAREILDAIERCPEERVVVLPNNKNVIASAEQAASQASKPAVVVPSRSIPEGIAAVLALNLDLPFEANAEAMKRALSSVRSAEVTRAVRSTTIDGKRIEAGQAIGLADGSVQVVEDDVSTAVERLVDELSSPGASLLTLYSGEDVRDEDAEALADALRKRHSSLEVELVRGGQPHYPYILSLE
ncbi:MAG: DAK2 domain-containing protein [Dehalococcoidia bacterium]|nr:DAK2 domain-containing protein [Dehalococcoidia bacterium]